MKFWRLPVQLRVLAQRAMAYKLTKKADADIITIYVEGVYEFGVAQAEKYHAELERIFELLSDSPMLARERKEITPPVRVHPHRSHLIIYSIDKNNDILIVRVRHGREDWRRNPVE